MLLWMFLRLINFQDLPFTITGNQFRPELYNRFHVSKFMVSAPAKIVVNTPMDQIMQIFDDTKAWNLPVVDETGRYMGFMSKSKIFNSYREVLVDNFSGD